jgi:hypothetical protein
MEKEKNTRNFQDIGLWRTHAQSRIFNGVLMQTIECNTGCSSIKQSLKETRERENLKCRFNSSGVLRNVD